jgi:very-short-patch-repair endonuclease
MSERLLLNDALRFGPIHGVTTRDALVDTGIGRRTIDANLASGQWERLFQSIYRVNPPKDAVEAWLGRLAAFALRGGVVSHRSAAALYKLDGLTWTANTPCQLIVPPECSLRKSNQYSLFRLPLNADDIGRLASLPMTTLARTLCDLAAHLSADELEAALESALRGPNNFEPDVWNEALLAELRLRSETPWLRGRACLQTVLARRTDSDRPTGSFPETVLFQAIRRAGLLAVRQPDIVFVRGRTRKRFFPDLGLLHCGLLVESDSIIGHSKTAQLQRDLERQNVLTDVFEIMRFPASEILGDADAVAAKILRRVAGMPLVAPDRIFRGYRMTPTATGLLVVDLGVRRTTARNG